MFTRYESRTGEVYRQKFGNKIRSRKFDTKISGIWCATNFTFVHQSMTIPYWMAKETERNTQIQGTFFSENFDGSKHLSMQASKYEIIEASIEVIKFSQQCAISLSEGCTRYPIQGRIDKQFCIFAGWHFPFFFI